MTRPRGSRFTRWLPSRPQHPHAVKRRPRLRVGLLGGSFNPAHEGHVAISSEALKRLNLDQVWWLVAPQNPLKDPGESAPYETRLRDADNLPKDPRIIVSDLEDRWGCNYTIETIGYLLDLFGSHDFVWLMGADNFATLHHWEDWTGIIEAMPIAVFNRPGYLLPAAASKAATRYARARLADSDAAALPSAPAPAWSFIEIPLHPISSTALREDGSR